MANISVAVCIFEMMYSTHNMATHKMALETRSNPRLLRLLELLLRRMIINILQP